MLFRSLSSPPLPLAGSILNQARKYTPLPATGDSDLELQPLQPTQEEPPPSLRRLDSSPPPVGNSSTRHERLAQSLKLGGKMKFSHSLIFNSVPEWTNYYIK